MNSSSVRIQFCSFLSLSSRNSFIIDLLCNRIYIWIGFQSLSAAFTMWLLKMNCIFPNVTTVILTDLTESPFFTSFLIFWLYVLLSSLPALYNHIVDILYRTDTTKDLWDSILWFSKYIENCRFFTDFINLLLCIYEKISKYN